MAATIDMHGEKPEITKASSNRGTPGRVPPRDEVDDGGYPYEDLTCDLSAEPIAAAMSTYDLLRARDVADVRDEVDPAIARVAASLRPPPPEGIVDPNPTLVDPYPPPLRGFSGLRAARARATAAPRPELNTQTRSTAAAKSAAPAVKRAPPAPGGPANVTRLPERPAATRAAWPASESAVETTAMLENTSFLESPVKAPPRAKSPPPAEQLPLVEPQAASGTGEHADVAGQRLCGRYELQLLLGRGGMASVYKAIDHDRARLGLADHIVAVKVVQASTARPASPAALLQEFQSAQRLSHPNVINVFDIDRDGDKTFYSMELLSGARLSQLLRRVDGTVLRREYALAIIRDIGAAVTHAHARGVVHADLKPSNVMITQDGEVRVLDFGGSSMPPREPWVSVGDADDAFHHATPAYASCEQLERKRVDPRDDIYALACIAYLLLDGRHPFDYLSSLEARSRGMQAPRRPGGMPRRQWRVLRQGLQWSRSNQPPAVEPWLAKLGLDGAVRRLPPLADLTAPLAPRSNWRGPVVAGAITAAIGVGAALLWPQSDIDWSQRLDSALNGTRDTLQSAWHTLVADDDKPLAPPADSPAPAAAPAASLAAPPPAATAQSEPAQLPPLATHHAATT
ncbi:MAG: protein kinase, partial [Steroidobacteraceae bacterium]